MPVSQSPFPPSENNGSAATDVTPVVALKELVARLHREQNKIQDLLSSLGFALRSFNNLNQFLELIPLMATRVTDADGSALFLYKPNGQVRLEQLHWQDSRQRKNIRKALENASSDFTTKCGPGCNRNWNFRRSDASLPRTRYPDFWNCDFG